MQATLARVFRRAAGLVAVALAVPIFIALFALTFPVAVVAGGVLGLLSRASAPAGPVRAG